MNLVHLIISLLLQLSLAAPLIKTSFASEQTHLEFIRRMERGSGEAEILEDPLFKELDPNFYCECNDSTIFYTAVASYKLQVALDLLKRGADPLRRVPRGKMSVFGLLFEQAIISQPKETVLPLLEELLRDSRNQKALLEGRSSKTTVPFLSHVILSPYRIELLNLLSSCCDLSVGNAMQIFQSQGIFMQNCNQLIAASKTQKTSQMNEAIWELTMNQKMINEIDNIEYAAFDRAATEIFSQSLQKMNARLMCPQPGK